LDKAYQELNQSVLERDCSTRGSVPPKGRFCNQAGVCLCTPAGRRLHKLREALQSVVIKPLSAPHTAGRQELKDGRWLVRLTGEVSNAMDLFASDAPIVETTEATLYYHICYQKLSPWRSTWHACDLAAEPHGEPVATEDFIYTKAGAHPTYNE
jgi:hypothetical protein